VVTGSRSCPYAALNCSCATLLCYQSVFECNTRISLLLLTISDRMSIYG
jgi:hypothetical protein